MSYDPNSLVNAMREARAIVGDVTPLEFAETVKDSGTVLTVLEDFAQLIELTTATGDLVMIATVDVRVAAQFMSVARIISLLAGMFGKHKNAATIRQIYIALRQGKLTSDESALLVTVRYSNKRALAVSLRNLAHYIKRGADR